MPPPNRNKPSSIAPLVTLPKPGPQSRHDTADDGTFDGLATQQAAPRPAAPSPRLLVDNPGKSDDVVDTDVSAQAIDENLAATESFERRSATMQTQAAPADDGHGTDAEGLPTVRPPTATESVSIAAGGGDDGRTDREKAKPPISTAPQSLPPPTEKQQTTSGPSPACPQCEAPMAWVEAHLRFYCKSCKMYF